MSLVPPTPPTIAPLLPFTRPGAIINNITPFTYRDGITYLEYLESLKDYLIEVVVPFIDESFDSLENKWADDMVEIIAAVNSALAVQTADNAAQMQALTDYVNAQVQLIINDAIEVQDPVVAGIVGDTGSETRIALDGLYAKDADINGLDARVDTVEDTLSGRLSDATLDSKYVPASVVADPAGRLSPAILDARFADKANQADVAAIEDTIENGYLSPEALQDLLGNTSGIALQVDRGASDTVLDPRLVRIRDGVINKGSINTRFAVLGSSTAVGGYTTYPDQGMFQRLAFLSGAKKYRMMSEVTAPLPTGVSWYSAALGGTTSANYCTADTVTKIATLNPNYVFHMIGSNDYANAVPLNTYKTNLRAAIGAIDGVAPGTIHILIHGQDRRDVNPAIPWASYGQALKEVADEAPAKRVFFDVFSVFNILDIKGDNYAGIEGADNLHMGNVGHHLMSKFFAAVLGIPDEEKFATREVRKLTFPATATYTVNTDIITMNIPAASYPRTVDVLGQAYTTGSGTNSEIYCQLVNQADGTVLDQQPIRVNVATAGSTPLVAGLYLPPAIAARFVLQVQPAGQSLSVSGTSYSRASLSITPA